MMDFQFAFEPLLPASPVHALFLSSQPDQHSKHHLHHQAQSGAAFPSEAMMMTMQMWFQTTTTVTLWFKAWHISSPLWYGMSCIGLFALCLLQEALSRWRGAYARGLKAPEKGAVGQNGVDSSSREDQQPLIGLRLPEQSARLLLSLAYGGNVITSYFLMLAVMTYNVGYFIVIVLGLSVGHYAFSSLFGGLESGTVSSLSELCCPQG
ncbi:hypothetical protein WJX73_001095 [Symbiochloris irregularis]|uniref:Copper transport protein n=1 Tax=Symbiochloris irregularis TaxID=706552 RepID=A0AAW1PJX2_9CHLO